MRDSNQAMTHTIPDTRALIAAAGETGAERLLVGPQSASDALKRFRMIFRSVRTDFHEVEQRCGIPGSQLWALAVVVQHPGIRVKELAQAMAIQQSTASNLVEQLARQALIRRERSASDQRSVQLQPTDRGRALVDEAPKPLAGMLPHALAQLEPERLRQLNTILDEVVSGMRRAGVQD